MRSLIGLFWALGGALIGGLLSGLAANLFASLTNMTSRDGAAGYFVIGIGLLGAVLGGVAGVVLYARRAPTGEAGAFALAGVLGVAGLIALVALSVWAFMNLREAPLEYDGAMANLELELRMQTSHMPADTNSRWLSVEVHTAKTRPEGTPLWSKARIEGAHTTIPVVQGPLYRAGSRIIVVTKTDAKPKCSHRA